MNQESKRNKGGRPIKSVKRDQLIALKCSLYEKKVIASKAKLANVTISEYLRELGLKGRINPHHKALTKEILKVTGTLNHLAANLNQIAKKRNSLDELNPLERARLNVQSIEVKQLALLIKDKLK